MTGVGFLLGVVFATFTASGYIFLKFWRRARDRFYLLFGVACWIIGVESILMQFVRNDPYTVRTPEIDATSWVFLLRSIAFLLILAAIVDKNRANGPR